MRIADLRTIQLACRNPDGRRWRWSGGYFDSWSSVFVQVVADDGTTGVGEVYQGACVRAAVAPFVDFFRRWLVGEDPLQPERLWQKLYDHSVFWNRHGYPIGVLGAIDIALHDLAGKALGVPVYELLGGARQQRLRVYYSAGCCESPEEFVVEVRHAISQNFTAYKWRVLDPANAARSMKKLREAVGNRFELMVDAVQGSSPSPWSKAQVIELAMAIEECGPCWLEEPFRIEDPAAYAELRRMVSYPIAGGESLTSVAELKAYLSADALDIFQPDLSVAGGFTLTKRLAALAEDRGVKIAMHSWAGAPALMANLHFAFAHPNCLWLECCQYPNPLRDRFLVEPLEIQDGCVAPPTSPGLGVRLTEELIQEYSFIGSTQEGLVFGKEESENVI